MWPGNQKIKVGTPVTINGRRGEVVRTVMPKEDPKRKLKVLLGTGRFKVEDKFSLKPRAERSFLIMIPAKSKKGKHALRWPRPEQVKPV